MSETFIFVLEKDNLNVPFVVCRGYSLPNWVNENTLVVQVGLDTNLDNGSDKIDKCEFKNFPLQKWVNVNVSMRNNVLDIFIDGTLVKSCILKGSPTINSGDLHIFKRGPNGYGFNG